MADNTKDHEGGSGEFCIMCGRSDKQAGKMVHLPGGLTVCPFPERVYEYGSRKGWQ